MRPSSLTIHHPRVWRAAPAASPPRRHGPAARGFTLMELLTVMGIFALMLGFSGAAYWRTARNFKEQAAAADLDVVLRQARNAAISANANAFVEINTEERRITPWVYRTVGFWHFEDRTDFGETKGAYHRGIMRGAELFPDGKIGKCARLREGSCIDMGADGDFDCEDGGFVEAYVRPATYTFTGDNFIFFKKNAYSLKIGFGGLLVGNAGSATVKSTDYHIVPGRWTKVAFAWDRYSTRLLVDDCLVGTGPGGRPPLSDYPLLIGHDTASLEGLVDEARIMSAAPGNALQLPPSCIIKHNAAPWNAVFFAADGTLDMRYHAGPVSITLIQERRARTVTVSMLGQTTRLEVEKLEKEPETGPSAAPKAKLKTLSPDEGKAPTAPPKAEPRKGDAAPNNEPARKDERKEDAKDNKGGTP